MSTRSPNDLTGAAREVAEAAIAVLRANDRANTWGRHTIPSAHLYPHQWAWDSAFAAIGWRHVDPERALVELEVLMKGAWPDGRVPHIYFHELSGVYFPGPDFWCTERSSSISQPPIWATAARLVWAVLPEAGRAARFAPLVTAMAASHRWYAEARDPLGWGAVAVVHPWESGLDNCAAWDSAMQAIDPRRAPAFRRVDQDRVEDPSQRPGDEEYKRYAVMVKDIAADGFGPGSGFAVYDPLMTAILCRAEGDLAWLAEACGLGEEAAAAAARRERLMSGLTDHLWSAAQGRFRYHDAIADAPVEVDTVGCYAPAMLALPEAFAAPLKAGLRARYATDFPIPSAAPSADFFDPKCYWRGPTWLNINWLLAPAMPEVVERTLALVTERGFWEYYDPHTGAGLGARDFTWSAALVLDWLCR